MPKILKLLLLASFVNGLVWISLIPIWQYPDEQAHFSQVQNLAEIGRVPPDKNNSKEIDLSEEIMGTKRTNGNNSYVYHPEYKQTFDQTQTAVGELEIINLPPESRKQFVKNESTQNPPFYYFLAAFAYKTVYYTDLFSRVFAARFVSLLIFLLLIVIAHKIAGQVFQDKPNLQLTLPALVAFMPMLVFASTGVLPDVLTNLLFATILYLGLRIISVGIQKKLVALSTAVILIGINTRQQFLIAVPILILALFIRCLISREHLKKLVLLTLASLLTVIAINLFGSAIPVISNFRMPESSALNPVQLLSGKFLWFIKWSLERTYAEALPWYWGVYKWLSLTLPPLTYQIINRILLVSAIGIAIRLVLVVKKRKLEHQDVILLYLVAASALYFLLFIVWDYFFYSQKGFSFGFQGRYYFPLIIAHLAIIIIGLQEIFRILLRKYTEIGFMLLVILMFFFNNFTLSFLAASYYNLETIQTFVLQASQYKPAFLKGDILLALPLLLLILQTLFVFSLWKRQNRGKSQ